MRKIKKLITTLLLTVTLLCGSTASVFASEQTAINYLALGDSITEGDNSYVQYINAYLSEKCDTLNSVNLGVSGCQSIHIAKALTDSTNEAYESIRYAISMADVITLDIGSNDVMVPIANVFCSEFQCAPEDLGTTMEGWANKVQNENNIFLKYIYYMQVSEIVNNIKNTLHNSDYMDNVVKEFETNYKVIIDTILELNPDVKLYIGNLYNPYHGFEPLIFADGTEIINFNTFADKYVSELNIIIDDIIADRYPIADIYSAFNDSTYINADYATGNYDPHPNAEGQKVIGKLFTDIMKGN